MLATHKKNIDDYIIEILAKNPYITGPILLEKISALRGKTSKQAVYTALSPLLNEEVVAKKGTKYYLTKAWLRRITSILNINTIAADEVFSLEDGDSITYHFPTLLSCDKYWAHLFSLASEWINESVPILVWNPHQIFVIGRLSLEEETLREVESLGKYTFCSIKGATRLDQDFKKNWRGAHTQINLNQDLGLKDSYYLNIFDDLLLEVFFPQELTDKIENFYQNHIPPLTKEQIQEFENFFTDKHTIRMKISRNKNKVETLRKKLSKDFHIPR